MHLPAISPSRTFWSWAAASREKKDGGIRSQSAAAHRGSRDCQSHSVRHCFVLFKDERPTARNRKHQPAAHINTYRPRPPVAFRPPSAWWLKLWLQARSPVVLPPRRCRPTTTSAVGLAVVPEIATRKCDMSSEGGGKQSAETTGDPEQEKREPNRHGATYHCG